jgi:hypothetical protein
MAGEGWTSFFDNSAASGPVAPIGAGPVAVVEDEADRQRKTHGAWPFGRGGRVKKAPARKFSYRRLHANEIRNIHFRTLTGAAPLKR